MMRGYTNEYTHAKHTLFGREETSIMQGEDFITKVYHKV